MIKTAVGLFKSSATADAVVALLLASGFSRDEVKLVKRSDFDEKPSPETDILKLGGVPAKHAGRYWDAVRGGLTLIAIAAGDRADRAVEIMDAEGAVYLEESMLSQPLKPLTWVHPQLTRASILDARQRRCLRFRKRAWIVRLHKDRSGPGPYVAWLSRLMLQSIGIVRSISG